MSAVALGLVLTAATVHAVWNLFAKRAGGGAVFVWAAATGASVLYLPVAVIVLIIQRDALAPVHLGLIAGSAALHTGYFVLLQRGYRAGDLSVVYPLARGTGPLLATLAAIVLFDERPSGVALSGALAVVAGVMILGTTNARTGGGPCGRAVTAAVGYGLATGVFIAAYTLWDARAVAALAVSPVILDWGSNLGRALLLAPVALRRRGEVSRTWRQHRTEVLVVAALSPLAYVLVLVALTFTPVSYVAPARELSIVIGTAFGARLLAEGHAVRRLAGAAAVVVGVAGLAVG